jgi:hypothetical protein
MRRPKRPRHARQLRGDVVIDEEPCCALFRQSAQRSLSRLLNISFVCRRRTQNHGKGRKSTQEAGARLGGTPTNARIQTSEAVSILNRHRSLADAAHALDRRATDRRLRHGSGLVAYEDGVEPVEFVSAASEACDTRRHPDEWSRRRRRCLRLALSSGVPDEPPTRQINPERAASRVASHRSRQGYMPANAGPARRSPCDGVRE